MAISARHRLLSNSWTADVEDLERAIGRFKGDTSASNTCATSATWCCRATLTRAGCRVELANVDMLTAIPARAVQMRDDWTIRSSNGALAAHEEHTIVIQRGRPLVLTT